MDPQVWDVMYETGRLPERAALPKPALRLPPG